MTSEITGHSSVGSHNVGDSNLSPMTLRIIAQELLLRLTTKVQVEDSRVSLGPRTEARTHDMLPKWTQSADALIAQSIID